jgi:hypothetical protein
MITNCCVLSYVCTEIYQNSGIEVERCNNKRKRALAYEKLHFMHKKLEVEVLIGDVKEEVNTSRSNCKKSSNLYVPELVQTICMSHVRGHLKN